MPGRIRGIVVGLLLLAVSPVIALAGAHHAATAEGPRAVTADGAADAQRVSRFRTPNDPSIAFNVPTPTPAPTPTPTPAPAPPVVRVASTPKPPPPAPPPAPGTIEAIIKAAADRYGVSYAWMLKIARCESGLNPRAYNPAGPYIGLFQFLPSTFRAHGGTDIYDPVQQADITANMLAHGGANAWGCA